MLYVLAVSVKGMYLEDIAVDDWLVLTSKYVKCDLKHDNLGKTVI